MPDISNCISEVSAFQGAGLEGFHCTHIFSDHFEYKLLWRAVKV